MPTTAFWSRCARGGGVEVGVGVNGLETAGLGRWTHSVEGCELEGRSGNCDTREREAPGARVVGKSFPGPLPTHLL